MAEAKKVLPAVFPSHKQIEFLYTQWGITVPNATTKEDLLRPEFWAHVARDLKPEDVMHVRTEDGSYRAELLVLDRGTFGAKMGVKNEYRFDSVEPSEQSSVPKGHKVEWSGPHTKFRVVRESDRKVLKDGFENKTEAFSWLVNHGKALAA